MERRLLVLFAETPIHAGGSESTGVVDLPIQREAATGLPVVWGQSLKGALRDAARDAGWGVVEAEKRVFGSRPPGQPEADGDADEGTGVGKLVKGEVSFGDAQLLLFPAPTLTHTYAWVTSRQTLSRLARKVELVAPGAAGPSLLPPPGDQAWVTPEWTGRQVLGPYVIATEPRSEVAGLGTGLARLSFPDNDVFDYSRLKLGNDLLYVADDVLSELANSGTDVVPRVQLANDTKTVQNLFYSEHLPAETLLASLLAGPAGALNQLTELLDGKTLQLGGDETLGKGLFWCRVHDSDSLRDVFPADASEKEAS